MDIDIKYLLQLHADYLAWLVSIWKPNVILLPGNNDMPDSWGPTAQDLASIWHYEFYKSTGGGGGDDNGNIGNDGYSDDEEEDEEKSDNEEEGLWEAIEELDLAGGYSEVDELEDEMFGNAGSSHMQSQRNSPNKHLTRI